MLYCDKCKVHVGGAPNYCPLCGGPVAGEGDPYGNAFPELPQGRRGLAYFFSWITFGCLAAALVCVAVDLVTPGSYWSLFAAGGIACAWLTFAVAIAKKNNVLKGILWEMVLITVLAVLWDIGTGWHGWSIDFVLPCSSVGAMISMFVLHKVMHLPAKDYIIYLVLDIIFGIVPVVFLILGMLRFRLPSLICIGTSLLMLAGLLLFQGHAIHREAGKKLHL